jgi:hypothetical protein
MSNSDHELLQPPKRRRGRPRIGREVPIKLWLTRAQAEALDALAAARGATRQAVIRAAIDAALAEAEAAP